MTQSDITIGFIGLGIMGGNMAAHLMASGHHLVVYNRTPEKAQGLVEQGAILASTPAEVASQSTILFTMLAHPDAVTETALGENGFLDTLPNNALWVDCSTVNPAFSRRMAAEAESRNVRFLEAPVAGSKLQAERGELIFIVGGRAEDVESCRPLFELMGQRVVHVGDHGMGISLKLVLNHLLGTSMVAFAEGVALGRALGLSQEVLLRALIGGPVTPPYLAGKQAKFETADFAAEFPLQWMHKDMRMVAEAAEEIGAATPLRELAQAQYQTALDHGLGELDFSAVYRVLNNEHSIE